MFGRRSHSRFAITPTSGGTLRILSDIILQPSENEDLIAISRDPGVVGEMLSVHVMTRHGTVRTPVRIAESRPIVANGAVRHWLRLEPARVE